MKSAEKNSHHSFRRDQHLLIGSSLFRGSSFPLSLLSQRGY